VAVGGAFPPTFSPSPRERRELLLSKADLNETETILVRPRPLNQLGSSYCRARPNLPRSVPSTTPSEPRWSRYRTKVGGQIRRPTGYEYNLRKMRGAPQGGVFGRVTEF
jgi:hypothetical protein